MRNIISTSFIFACGFFLVLQPHSYAKTTPAQDIEMLPPTQTDGTACNFNGSDNVLMLHGSGSGGVSGINCNPNVTADPVGNLTVGNSLNITGQTKGAMTGLSSDTVLALQQLPACATNQALVKDGSASFSCINVSDIQNVGTVTLPTCAAGQSLTWNGSVFSCMTLPTISNATCPDGYYVNGIQNGAPTCAQGGQQPTANGSPVTAMNIAVTGEDAWNNAIVQGLNYSFGPNGDPGTIQGIENECGIHDPSQENAAIFDTTCRGFICVYGDPLHRLPVLHTTVGECFSGDVIPGVCNGTFGVIIGCEFMNTNVQYNFP